MGAVEERVKALEATPRVKEVMTAAGLASPATPAKPAPSMRSAASLKSAASLLPRECDFILYKERNLIERLFGKLKQFRAIATRYDKFARNFLGAIRLVAAVIQLN